MRAKHATKIGSGLLVLVVLNGCAVGPEFRPPQLPPNEGYTHDPPPEATQATAVAGGEAQQFRLGDDLTAQWWTLFGSPQIDALIADAWAHYPDIDAQQAALRAALEYVRAEQGVFVPQVTGSGAYQRERVSGASIGPGFPAFITSIYQATINVSYTFDFFGGERRALEGLEAQAEVQKYQLEASYLTLTSNIVSTVIQVASLSDQIKATREIISIENKQLDFTRRRFEVGSQTRSDVLQQESNLALVRATLPTLEQRRDAAEHKLAVLTGHSPREVSAPKFALSDFKLPQDLPISLPSSLVAQRPDIKAQEALMHQASAAVGVSTANMLPKVTLSGSIGNESLSARTLFQPGSNIWNLATGITQPLFEGGALRARRRAAIDVYDQAAAQYQTTVLKAFQNVADTLTALDHDAQTLRAEFEAMNAAEDALDLTQKQYDAGGLTYVSLLAAQLTYNQARLAYIQAIASRYTDTVTLFQALGGGWWNRG